MSLIIEDKNVMQEHPFTYHDSEYKVIQWQTEDLDEIRDTAAQMKENIRESFNKRILFLEKRVDESTDQPE